MKKSKSGMMSKIWAQKEESLEHKQHINLLNSEANGYQNHGVSKFKGIPERRKCLLLSFAPLCTPWTVSVPVTPHCPSSLLRWANCSTHLWTYPCSSLKPWCALTESQLSEKSVACEVIFISFMIELLSETWWEFF